MPVQTWTGLYRFSCLSFLLDLKQTHNQSSCTLFVFPHHHHHILSIIYHSIINGQKILLSGTYPLQFPSLQWMDNVVYRPQHTETGGGKESGVVNFRKHTTTNSFFWISTKLHSEGFLQPGRRHCEKALHYITKHPEWTMLSGWIAP